MCHNLQSSPRRAHAKHCNFYLVMSLEGVSVRLIQVSKCKEDNIVIGIGLCEAKILFPSELYCLSHISTNLTCLIVARSFDKDCKLVLRTFRV